MIDASGSLVCSWRACTSRLFTSDPDSAKAFYGGLLGWDAEEPNPEIGGYTNFTSGDVRVAGLMRNDGGQGAPDFWTTYLAVADAAAAVEASTAAGAQLHVPSWRSPTWA